MDTKRNTQRRAIWLAGIGSLLAGLAACSSPPPPAPPPPVVEAPKPLPPRPVAPGGATDDAPVPAVGPDGVRHTILTDETDGLKLWSLRAALNVAALNCAPADYATITPAYRAFLTRHAKALAAANKAVDKDFRDRYGKAFVPAREEWLTHLYNYYAFPPVTARFCAAVQDIAAEDAQVANPDLPAYSMRSMARLTAVYEEFYRAYEAYKRDLALWQALPGQPLRTAPAPTVVAEPMAQAAPQGISPEPVVPQYK